MIRLVLIALAMLGTCQVKANEPIDWPKLMQAIGERESGLYRNAWNKLERAAGIYQMRPLALKDASDWAKDQGGKGWTEADLYDTRQAAAAMRGYYMRWRHRARTPEEFCRLWNGGSGWIYKAYKTDEYAASVTARYYQLVQQSRDRSPKLL